MRILDITAGNRAVWHDKNHPDAIFIDRRPEAAPTIVADSRRIPLADGLFDLIIFDPPHDNFGTKSHMSSKYGHSTGAEIKDLVAKAGAEAWRVSRPDALMAFKWNSRAWKLSRALSWMQEHWEPLIQHGMRGAQKHRGMTSWCLLRRRSAPWSTAFAMEADHAPGN